MASELRVNSSTNRSGLGTITYTDSGPIISGVGTFSNGFTVDGTQTTVKSLKLTGDNYNANWFKTSDKLRFNDNAKATFGTADDLSVYHDGNNSYIQDVGTGQLRFLSNDYVFYNAGGNENLLRITENSGVSLYDGADTVRLATTSTGVTITGTAVAGALDISGDIDVDGHTELDNVNIAGVVTATQFKSVNGSNTGFFKDNQLSFSPTGHAYIDHGTTAKDIYFRLSRASALDTTMMQFDSDGEIIKFHKMISVGLQGGGDTATLGGGSGVGAQLTLKYADGTFNTRLLGNNNSYLNVNHGNLGIGTAVAGKKLHVFKSNQHPVILERGDNANTQIELKSAAATRGYWGASDTSNFMVYDNDASNINFTVLQTGDVGIGTDSPQSSGLTVLRNSEARLQVWANGDGSNGKVALRADGSNTQIGTWSNHDCKLVRNSTIQASISSNGISFPAGKGIDFSATSDANGTMASELFADYERGTHTYSVTSSSTNPTVNTGTYNKLYYTKVGDMVHVTGELRWTISSHGSGHLRISLPFTSDSTSNSNSQGTAQTWNVNWRYGRSDAEYLLSEVLPGTNYMIFRVACNDSLNEPYLSCGSNYQKTANSGYGVEYQVSIWYRTG